MSEERKAQLAATIETAREELAGIQAVEYKAKYMPMLGKCFKYRNSYSCPQTEADYWYMYARIVDVGDSRLKLFRFQLDSTGKFEVERYAEVPCLTESYVPIGAREFLDVWLTTLIELSRIQVYELPKVILPGQ